jgi:hypothetical protein
MTNPKKITVDVPEHILKEAQIHTGVGISETVRLGLELLVAKRSYAALKQLRGKVKFSRTVKDLKRDRT